ncbi:MAG: HK97 gp10 family phage protein, partial [Gammaproteobacteria bacterium]
AKEIEAKFQVLPDRLFKAAKSALDAWASELASYIKENKLSGDPLHRRSGRLSSSVHPVSKSGTDFVSGGAGGGAAVPYARIHEYGGLIPAHTVFAKNAKALMIPLSSGTIFRKWANIPEIHMPERSYMRSAMKERAQSGIDELKQALHDALLA